MDNILGAFGFKKTTFNERNDDDLASRLSHVYSTALCIVFAIIVSSKQYVGEPIQCWVPAHFSNNWQAYTNTYCWIKNTYYAPFNEELPMEDDHKQMVPYYQWMPMILLIQALIFYLPILLWRKLASSSGVSIDTIIDTGTIYEQACEADFCTKIMDQMTNQMDTFLNVQQNELKTKCTVSLKHILSRTVCACCGRRQGNYLTTLYLFIKLLFIGVIILQLFLLNFLLGYDYHLYGIEVMRTLFNKEEWIAAPHFPRVTMCDFNIRRLGNLHRYTVQCVLPINLFNEKIYLFLWFWMAFMVFVMTYSFLSWFVRCVFRGKRLRYIKKQLTLAKMMNRVDEERFNAFLDEYLRSDGVFMLRLFAKNRNASTVTDLIGSLWVKFNEEEDEKEHAD